MAQKQSFLASKEFYDLLAQRSSKMVTHGFNGAIRQFIKAKIITQNSDLSFLDVRKVWNDLPDSKKGDAPPEVEKVRTPPAPEGAVVPPGAEKSS